MTPAPGLATPSQAYAAHPGMNATSAPEPPLSRATEWTTVRDQLRAWSAAFGGLVVMWSETGLGNSSTQGTDPAAWLANMRDMFPAMSEFRPTVWAVTYGGGWRLNKSSTDPTLLPSLERAFIQLQRDIAAQRGREGP